MTDDTDRREDGGRTPVTDETGTTRDASETRGRGVVRRSELFAPTAREARIDGTATTRLLSRAGYVTSHGSGLWGYTPVGQRVRRRLIERTRRAFRRAGGQQVTLPQLGTADLWRASGRWASFDGEMFTTETREGRELCLSPSHEEAAAETLAGVVRSYADLPVTLFQVGRKFRDDHANDGLVRTKEFTMADAYSFHATRESLQTTYRRMRAAIGELLAGLGLEYALVPAETGVMGGSMSLEFVAPVSTGGDRLRHCAADGCRFGRTEEHDGWDAFDAETADTDAAADANATTDRDATADAETDATADASVVGRCPECGGRVVETRGIEVAHVFQLGTRYAEAAGLTVDTATGEQRAVRMGSYGVGIDRTLQTLVRQYADSDGVRFPATDRGTVAPFRASVVPIGDTPAVRELCDWLERELSDALVYDGDRTAGERFAESDLLGIPVKVVLGNRYRETGRVELETRDGTTRTVQPDAVHAAIDPGS